MYSSVVIRTRAARPPDAPQKQVPRGLLRRLALGLVAGCERMWMSATDSPTFSSTAKFSRLVVAACIGRRLAQRCEADDAGR